MTQTTLDPAILVDDLSRNPDLGAVPNGFTLTIRSTDNAAASRKIDFGGGGPDVEISADTATGALLAGGLASEPELLASGRLSITGSLDGVRAVVAAMNANHGLAAQLASPDLANRWRGFDGSGPVPAAFPDPVPGNSDGQRWVAAWVLGSLPPECQAAELPRVLPRPSGKFKRSGVGRPDDLLKKTYACAHVASGGAAGSSGADPDTWTAEALAALADRRPARAAAGHIAAIRGATASRRAIAAARSSRGH